MAAQNPLAYAIQMEQDGQRYYSEAAARTANPLGKRMFESLAADERRHEEVLRQTAEAMAVSLEGEMPKQRLVTLFSTLGDDLRRELGAQADEASVFAKAIEMEKASVAHYRTQADAATRDSDKALYERLVQEEAEHVDILVNTQAYLDNTGQWFLWDEQSLLDGG